MNRNYVKFSVKKLFLLCWLLVFSPFARTWGEDARGIPVDMYIIIDSSSSMEKGKGEAVNWLCTTVIDGIARAGDSLSVWTAGVRPELIYSRTVSAETKEEAKNLIRQIRFSGGAADYKGALSEVRAKALAGPENRMIYTLLVSGANPKDPPIKEAESAGLLLYSRVESFSGWRVFTIGLDVSARVRESADSYMKNR
ncbi:MAG: VWA domain-containing protein [Treponema sp.]|nr:VWA domain-containing protein [Treponema sp.]